MSVKTWICLFFPSFLVLILTLKKVPGEKSAWHRGLAGTGVWHRGLGGHRGLGTCEWVRGRAQEEVPGGKVPKSASSRKVPGT
jgi:hypothetical protein